MIVHIDWPEAQTCVPQGICRNVYLQLCMCVCVCVCVVLRQIKAAKYYVCLDYTLFEPSNLIGQLQVF